ncbi:MAG: hypothetical protein ACOCPN_04785, partial [Desulfonatronovibrionaceae bacterium]
GTGHVIDPCPAFDPEEWGKTYQDAARFHTTLSLNDLPEIPDPHAVLIDGDHNWYTVYNELKLIEKNARACGSAFPLIFLHDMCWPYARRDLYYDPDNIPEAFRKPFKKMGISPDSRDLVQEGGLNPHLFNAIYENNLQNGVLTAVEDFISQSSLCLNLRTVPLFNGLGILFDDSLNSNHSFSRIVSQLSFNPLQTDLLALAEDSRNRAQIRDAQRKQLIRELKDRLVAHERELKTGKKLTEKYFLALARAEKKVQTLQQRANALAAENRTLSKWSQHTLHEAEQTKTLAGSVMKSIARDTDLIEQSTTWKSGTLLVKLAQLVLLRPASPTALDHIRQNINKLQKQLQGQAGSSPSSDSLKTGRAGAEAEKLINQLHSDFKALKGSARWKAGSFALRPLEIMLLRFRPRTAMDALQDIFDRWQGRSAGQAGSHAAPAGPDSPEVLIRQLRGNFQLVFASRRWKTGCIIIRALEKLLLRPAAPTAEDHVNQLLKEYAQKSDKSL